MTVSCEFAVSLVDSVREHKGVMEFRDDEVHVVVERIYGRQPRERTVEFLLDLSIVNLGGVCERCRLFAIAQIAAHVFEKDVTVN